jgi:hypothetical protein
MSRVLLPPGAYPDPHTTFPTVTVRDSVTGQTRTTSQWNLFNLLEGNFTCDCNRELLFLEEFSCSGTCLGCHRYWVVAVDPMPPGDTLEDFNVGYPDPNRK